MNRVFIRKHITTISIAIFIILFLVIQSFKPHFLYNTDGSIKTFGLGYKKKTILPMWVISISIAIFCYTAVLYYLALPRIKY